MDILKIPKIKRPATLWVHPDGQVVGHLFLREHSPYHAGPEDPLEALNQAEPFLVFACSEPEELRFYNRRCIVRVEYEPQPGDAPLPWEPLACQLAMMDGSLITGSIQEPLPPDRSRLLDYFNRAQDAFVRIHTPEGGVCLVNKAYVNHVRVED